MSASRSSTSGPANALDREIVERREVAEAVLGDGESSSALA
jgi:hypothetical protein